MRAYMPSLNPELTCNLQALNGVAATAEGVLNTGGRTKGRMLTEFADCKLVGTGGREDGSSCVSLSDSSSEINASLRLEIHKMWCITM